MKKKLSLLLTALLLVVLAACGNGEKGASKEESNKLVVGASAVPHAQILEKAKPILADEGIELEVKVFQDYILPNKTLEAGELDANYFQTPGYLALEMEEKGYDFVSVGEIHKEPIGIYSKKYKSLEELPEGAEIIISTSDSDQGRILPIFEKAGLIKLKEGVGENARVEDIVENPKNLDFSTRIEAKLLATSFENGEGDAVVINANYALEGDVNLEEGIAFEGSDVVPANLIVVRKEDENNENIKKLVEVLKSKEIQDFIKSEYKDSVIPVTE
ncbi:MetQ/NlpA family ABC transporter substrate-binding protein [Metabacillus niabensis]|uniref:Lipoprotein n=1 Tax=Metabacillus niabensis TaxID=324854 RepID=A0ABT9YZQ6_9BACI|nr:MetQ/NlpA family ABC transporter substrate-binding protein [Metabacillus niabensis]MDQ0225481.1 D-methionine transport system substrate-binding protein [Metabacillus niabensis]PAD70936.1 methionine ABC transporter substrate-binding protein [Bacillus sp. 7586-K]